MPEPEKATKEEPKKDDKDDKKKDDKKKKADEEDELSEEDQALQAQMELLVTRVSDPEPALRLTALESMVNEVRTATSSMTSVPKPLKFLRPHFGTLKGNYESASAGPTKTMLADVLSLLAMTMGEDGKRESLNYKLLGSREDVFEGERSMTKDCHLLGKFDLGGIPPAPRGVPQIEVSFEINADGILHVSAADKANGNAKSIQITNDKGRLSQEEIDRMIEEAEEFQEQDQKERERVEARNTLEGYIFQSKSTLNGADNGGANISDQLSDDERETIERALEDVNEWLDDHQDAEKSDLDGKLAELRELINPFFTKAYERAGAPKPGGFGENGASDDLDGHDEL